MAELQMPREVTTKRVLTIKMHVPQKFVTRHKIETILMYKTVLVLNNSFVCIAHVLCRILCQNKMVDICLQNTSNLWNAVTVLHVVRCFVLYAVLFF